MDISAKMQAIDLFQGVSPEKIRFLAARSTYKKFRRGEMILGEADPIRAFYVVVSGQLKLYRSSAEGKEQTLQLLGPGDPFGLCTAFATDSFPASAMAINDAAVLLIPGAVIEAAAKEEPALLLNIIRILSARLKNSMNLIESLSLKELPGRVASFLRHESVRNLGNKKATVELALSQREMAKIVGATPEALSRTLKKMAGEGILSTAGRTITVLDQTALEKLAEGE